MPSRSVQDRPTPERREAVLESAIATFARFGYRKTSMEQVALAAQISRPGLYFLFASKEALFRAAATQVLQRDLAAVERVLQDGQRPLPERVVEAFDQWSGRYVGPLARDVHEVIEANPALLGDVVQALSRRFGDLLTSALAEQVGPDQAVRIARTLNSASLGMKLQSDSRQDYRERLEVAVGLLVSQNPE